MRRYDRSGPWQQQSCSLHFRPRHCGPFTATISFWIHQISTGLQSLVSLSLSLSLSLSRPHLVNNEECVLHHGCACSLESTECVTELRPKYLYKRFWGAPPKASGFSRNSIHPRLGRFGEFEMVLDTTRGGEEELRAPRRSVQNPGQLANPHVLACPPRESIFFAPWYWGLSARGRAVPPRWARGVSFVVLLST